MEAKILAVDDEREIADLVELYLKNEGFTVYKCYDGDKALELIQSQPMDLALLDVMLPGIDGFELCRVIRESYTYPVIMLTAKSETFDKVSGLELGADDYIAKPFEMREVIARIHAVMRRFDDDDAPAKLEFDNLIIDKESYNIVVKGKKMEIPPKEIELLYFLASSPNRVFTRSQLLDDVWGFDYFGDTRTVDVHIKRLREKLSGASDQWELKTVWGVGYKFETVG